MLLFNTCFTILRHQSEVELVQRPHLFGLRMYDVEQDSSEFCLQGLTLDFRCCGSLIECYGGLNIFCVSQSFLYAKCF